MDPVDTLLTCNDCPEDVDETPVAPGVTAMVSLIRAVPQASVMKPLGVLSDALRPTEAASPVASVPRALAIKPPCIPSGVSGMEDRPDTALGIRTQL